MIGLGLTGLRIFCSARSAFDAATSQYQKSPRLPTNRWISNQYFARSWRKESITRRELRVGILFKVWGPGNVAMMGWWVLYFIKRFTETEDILQIYYCSKSIQIFIIKTWSINKICFYFRSEQNMFINKLKLDPICIFCFFTKLVQNMWKLSSYGSYHSSLIVLRRIV